MKYLMMSETYRKIYIVETMEEKLQKEAYLKSIINGSSRAKAAEAANTCTSTIWNWRQRDEEFKKAEQIALQSRIEVVVDALFQNAVGREYTDKKGNKHRKSGNVIAQIFWAKNRGKGKWKEKQELEIKDIKTINIKAFIQAGKEPVIKEEEVEKKELGEDIEEEKVKEVKEIETVL